MLWRGMLPRFLVLFLLMHSYYSALEDFFFFFLGGGGGESLVESTVGIYNVY